MERQIKETWLLNPLDRAAEILFGLIMALTFTCSISIVTKETQIRQLIFGAIGCNLAWGLVDATMFLIGELAGRNRNRMIFDSAKNSPAAAESHTLISEVLPPAIASAIEPEVFEHIRTSLLKHTVETNKVRLTGRDLKKALVLWLLIFVSTFPVVIPFVIIDETRLALRISNLVAILMMFFCGWSVAGYVGANKWIISFAMVIIGIVLVAITIVLGG